MPLPRGGSHVPGGRFGEVSETPVQEVSPYGNYALPDRQGLVETNETLVSMDKLVSSTIQGYRECCKAFSFSYSVGRSYHPHAGAAFHPSGAVMGSHLVLVLPLESFIGPLMQKMGAGEMVQLTKVITVAHIAGKPMPIYTGDFKQCYVSTIEPRGDRVVLGMRYGMVTHTFTDYGQDGSKRGNTTATLDFITGVIGK